LAEAEDSTNSQTLRRGGGHVTDDELRWMFGVELLDAVARELHLPTNALAESSESSYAQARLWLTIDEEGGADELV
jgi:hypothetical protein